MNRKYRLTAESTTRDGVTIHRICAVVDIASQGVKSGDVGGWIEREDNLLHHGDSWVAGNACVSGDARVSGNACVSGDARVFGNALVSDNACVSGDARVSGNALVLRENDVFLAGPIGSRGDYLTVARSESGLLVATGCFCGSLDDFAAAVEETHGASAHGVSYRAAIALAQLLLSST